MPGTSYLMMPSTILQMKSFFFQQSPAILIYIYNIYNNMKTYKRTTSSQNKEPPEEKMK